MVAVGSIGRQVPGGCDDEEEEEKAMIQYVMMMMMMMMMRGLGLPTVRTHP